MSAGSATREVRTSPFGGVNSVFIGYELRRRFNRQTTIFTLLLPAVLYLALFRTAPDNATLPHGNFAAWMMTGIAVYGAATAAVSSAATISVEKASGWMRTMALSPLAPPGYLFVKVLSSVIMAAVPVTTSTALM